MGRLQTIAFGHNGIVGRNHFQYVAPVHIGIHIFKFWDLIMLQTYFERALSALAVRVQHYRFLEICQRPSGGVQTSFSNVLDDASRTTPI